MVDKNPPFGSWPEGFVCNVKDSKYHGSPDARVRDVRIVSGEEKEEMLCGCVKCILEKMPWMTKGEPAATIYRSSDELKTVGMVGVYRIGPQAYLSCGVCNKSLSVSDPNHIAKVRAGRHHVVHFDCLSPDEKEKIGGVVPYVLKSVEKCDCGAELEEEKDGVCIDCPGGEVLRSRSSEAATGAAATSGSTEQPDEGAVGKEGDGK